MMLCGAQERAVPERATAPYLGRCFYMARAGKVPKNKKKLKRRFKGLQKGYGEGLAGPRKVQVYTPLAHKYIHGNTYRLRANLYSNTVFKRNAENETGGQVI